MDYTDGDGTVPADSAAVPGTPSIHTVAMGGVAHLDLAKNSLVLDTAVAILQASANAPELAFKGMQATSAGLAGIDLETSGSARLVVTDAAGEEDGVDPNDPGLSYLQQIPDSTFEQAMNTDSAFVVDGGNYHAAITTTDSGPLRVSARAYANGAVSEVATFYLADVPAGAVLTLDYSPAMAPDQLRLQVDLNGDGTVDETLSPSTTTAAGDTTPPTTIGGANLSAPGVSTVQLAADDGGGSGVATTWYELPGDTTPRVYAGPFTARLGTSIRFRSIDKAGNLEDVKTLVVDDVSNERTLAQPLAPPPPLQRAVDSPTDIDWFRFTADGTSTYTVQLGGAPGSTLALYSADGTLITSAPSGPGVKKIETTPPAGTYYLNVAAASGAHTPLAYVLDLHVKKAP
jgi:hypothetical protein